VQPTKGDPVKGIARILVPLFVLDVVLFALSGIFKDDTHGARWVLGGIGWFGFLLTSLALIVLAATALVRSRRRSAAA
jgi:hypothetical protein